MEKMPYQAHLEPGAATGDRSHAGDHEQRLAHGVAVPDRKSREPARTARERRASAVRRADERASVQVHFAATGDDRRLWRFINWTIRQRQSGQFACFAVVPHGLDSPIGIFQIRSLEPTFGTAEWGFALASEY